MKAEDLKVNKILRGPIFSEPVQIIVATPMGEAVKVVGRGLPAMLTTAQTAVLLGLAEHDVPVLVRTGLLKPLGNPPPNAVKSFCTAHVLELAGEPVVLNKIRQTVYDYWRGKNASKAKPFPARNGHSRNLK